MAITFSDDFRELSGNYGILANIVKGECFVGSAWGGEFCAEVCICKDILFSLNCNRRAFLFSKALSDIYLDSYVVS